MFENWAIGSTVNMTNETITKGLNESLNLTNSTVGNSTLSYPYSLIDITNWGGLLLFLVVAVLVVTIFGNAIKFVSR